MLRPLIQPLLKQVLAQRVSSRLSVLATGGLKRGQVQVPEGATFYAPLQINPMDYAGGAPFTFERLSDGLYLSGGVWRVAGTNVPRFEGSKLLMEPAITNKATNYNAAVDAGLTNLAKTGDAAAVMSRVDDSALLAAAGLGAIGNGFVVELDNSAGAVSATIEVAGNTTNTNPHTLSAYCRKVSGASVTGIRLTSGGGSVIFTNTADYQRITSKNVTPGGAGNKWSLFVGAGSIARFCLNQLEETVTPTSPIVTQGAAGQRAMDTMSWANSRDFVNDDAGMAILTYEWRGDFAALASGDQPSRLLGETQAIGSMLYSQRANGNYRHVSYDGVSFASAQVVIAPVYGDVIYAALRWKIAAPAEFQVGIYENGTWMWGAASTYDGQFPNNGQGLLYLGSALEQPFLFSDLVIYNEDRGTDWIEANYP